LRRCVSDDLRSAQCSCVQRSRQPALADELTCFGPAALRNKAGTCLFRHEIAYVLGQMQAKSAVPALLEVLKDKEDDPIVRHEVRDVAQECGRSGLLVLGTSIRIGILSATLDWALLHTLLLPTSSHSAAVWRGPRCYCRSCHAGGSGGVLARRTPRGCRDVPDRVAAGALGDGAWRQG